MKKRRVKGPKVRFPGAQNYISDAINNVVNWVESLPGSQEIKAGPNIFIRQDDETCIIESTAAPAATAAQAGASCSFGFEKFDISAGGVFKLRATGGLINGLIPTNFEEIASFSPTGNYYIYIEAEVGNTGIHQLTYESSQSPPGITPQVSQGSPPNKFKIIAAYLNEGEINKVLCSDIQATPKVYSYDNDTNGNLVVNWWWQFQAFNPSSIETATT